MVTILQGDCREVLKTLESKSVHTCVTSPPYYGLRDYLTARWEGGDENCTHSPADTPKRRGVGTSTLSGGKKTTGHQREGYGSICLKCGARRIDQQIGLEQTPEMYVQNLVGVFRDVRRVLRDDGTLWLNLGDSYARQAGDDAKRGMPNTGQARIFLNGLGREGMGSNKPPNGYKPKDLLGIPWRVAFSLQADGWYLRSDIIWHKPNPMPESVEDRPTKSHEYIFLLTKSEKYFYDGEAIREEAAYDGRKDTVMKGSEKYANGFMPNQSEHTLHARGHERWQWENGKAYRNKRSVWTIATTPYTCAHFATYPPELIAPCIQAGCPDGGTVLDPFAGSGTTGEVCEKFGRNSILIELNPAYIELIKQRTGQMGLFAKG